MPEAQVRSCAMMDRGSRALVEPERGVRSCSLLFLPQTGGRFGCIDSLLISFRI